MMLQVSLHISRGWVREWVDGRVIFRSTERRNVETFRGKRAEKRMSSGPLLSPQAQRERQVQNGFSVTEFSRWEASLRAGPTREICRLASRALGKTAKPSVNSRVWLSRATTSCE